MYCPESNRSWCTSNRDNDQRAITVECASDTTHPYAMNDAVYECLIALCTDICRRYNRTKLLWFADKDKYKDIFDVNVKMTKWIISNIDRISVM